MVDVRLNNILQRKHGDASTRIIFMSDMLKMVTESMTYEEVLSYWGIAACAAQKMIKTMNRYETHVARNAAARRRDRATPGSTTLSVKRVREE